MQKQSKREFKKIQYSNQTRKSNINIKRGTQQETTSLNINLKTISKGYLLQLISNTHSPEQTAIISQYIKESANFGSTRKLFCSLEGSGHQSAHQDIRKHMENVYTEADFVRKVLRNEKMDLRTKLLFIKFLEKIRLSALRPNEHKLWKQRF